MGRGHDILLLPSRPYAGTQLIRPTYSGLYYFLQIELMNVICELIHLADHHHQEDEIRGNRQWEMPFKMQVSTINNILLQHIV